jgi:hypothetical protein
MKALIKLKEWPILKSVMLELTNSMEPSLWEANSCSPTHESTNILENPKFHGLYPEQEKSSPNHSILFL